MPQPDYTGYDVLAIRCPECENFLVRKSDKLYCINCKVYWVKVKEDELSR